LKGKWQYVLLPYLLVSIPAIVLRLSTGSPYILELAGYNMLEYPVIVQILIYLVTGAHLLPLWYLPMIAIFFLLSPIFKLMDGYPRLYWILPLLLILSFLLPRNELGRLNNIPYMFGHFLFVYCFGMFFSHYATRIMTLISKHLMTVIFTLLISLFFSITGDVFIAQIIFIQKLIFIFLLMYLFERVKSKGLRRFFSELADTSFGIYFVHFYFILGVRIICKRFWGFEYPTSWVMWVLTFLSSIAVSYLVVILIKKVSGTKSRYFIGS
jgi:peptidoglycan/LPS O-acetylase OafA/YrhL